jgi:hypothetical protein
VIARSLGSLATAKSSSRFWGRRTTPHAEARFSESRREFFESIDRPAQLPLPAEPYQYAEWRRARVAPDYHIEVRRHFYSVPSV